MSDGLQDDAAAPLPPKRRRVLGIGAVLLVVIVVVGLWLAFRAPPQQVQGMADADVINVSAKIAARIATLEVTEGDRVEAGQVLFTLDSPEVAARERQAQAALDAARAVAEKADAGARDEEIRAARANWQRAQAGAELATSTYRRVDTLYGEGVMTRQKRDEARAQARSSDALAEAARAQYDQALAGARPEDREAAQAQVRQAEGAMAEVESAREETRGRAPATAEVGTRMADVGELVPVGYPVFTLVDIDRMWVAVNLRESQMREVRPGHRMTGAIPALDARDVAFEVYFVSPAGDYATWRATRESSGYDVRSFEVRLRPVAPVDGFRPGMSVLFEWPEG